MNLDELLKSISNPPCQLIAPEISFDHYLPIDLSVSNSDLNKIDPASSSSLSQYIQHVLTTKHKLIAYGGYLERRNIYQRSPHFNADSFEYERNIHLGVDLWFNENAPVLAAFDGRVHSFKYNTAFGDYGPTIILEHHIEGMPFFTLYGHLSLDSLDNIAIGAPINAGDGIGVLGSSNVNGDYPPHLHFQIIKDLQGNFGDYPGVCSESELEFYRINCPDPNIILKL